MSTPAEPDPQAALQAIEYYFEQGWTDGLPVAPATESRLEEFLATTSRDAEEVLTSGPQWGVSCTVRQAAINAIMAGCKPEYLPVVIAAIEALWGGDKTVNPLLVSTTGSAPMLVVNGPIRTQIGLNCAGSVFGSGFRANQTIGRAIRLIVLNVFGLRPHELDQATQASPAKYTTCVGENEDESPWAPLHMDLGFRQEDSTVSTFMARGSLHIEHRHYNHPERLLMAIADAMSYGGAQFAVHGPMVVAMGPEHAHFLAHEGWSKERVKQFLLEHYGKTMGELRRMGKGGFEERGPNQYWLVDEPNAKVMDGSAELPDEHFWRFGRSLDDILLFVTGANNAGISTVIPPIGAVGGRRNMALIENRLAD
ncbi:MAG: hypothetical protein JO247_17475 [Chloroflexi bacterium]|nr:hypothetical protein [Chloroflexota bacterium]